MSLDAAVYCNCVETGCLLTPHPLPHLLYIDYTGAPELRSTDLAQLMQHDAWRGNSPCIHDECMLVLHWLGNIALIGMLRRTVNRLIADAEHDLPVLSKQVIYNGVHCGDILEPPDVRRLAAEVEHLQRLARDRLEGEEQQWMEQFLAKLEELIQASQQVDKPIAF